MAGNNVVKMIGPKGKTSFVSRKASESKHLANLGFRIANDVIPQAARQAAPSNTTKPTTDAGKA